MACNLNPAWINWNDGQGYRKIIPANATSVEFLDWQYTDTDHSDSSYDYQKGNYVFTKNPWYMWHLDNNSEDGNLRISRVDQMCCGQDDCPPCSKGQTPCCPDTTKTGCFDSSSQLNVVGGASATNSCRVVAHVKDNVYAPDSDMKTTVPFFTTDDKGEDKFKDTGNRWYYDESTYIVPGSFCGFASGSYHQITMSPPVYESGVSNNCNPGKTGYVVKPFGEPDTYGDAYLDEINAVQCCGLPADEAKINPICSGTSFDPTADLNLCVPLVTGYCETNWNNSATCGGQTCQQFLENSPKNAETIQTTFMNYVKSRVPNDYVSKKLKDVNSFSKSYYDDRAANGEDSDRDDSTDPFFTSTLPYLCNFGTTVGGVNSGNLEGVCDLELNYFCQAFDRTDLLADPTLMNICGCHLLPSGGTPIYPENSPSIGGNQMDLQMAPQTISPYYDSPDNTDSCDSICTGSKIQNETIGGPCQEQMCIIDDVMLTYIQSDSGDVDITQNCNGGTCYITDKVLNVVDSKVGALNITQNCGSCYTFTGNDITNSQQQVDCGTLNPDNGGGGGNGGGGNGGGDIKCIQDSNCPPFHKCSDGKCLTFFQRIGQWIEDRKYLVISLVILFIVAILGIILIITIKHNKKKTNVKPEIQTPVISQQTVQLIPFEQISHDPYFGY